MPSQLYTNDNVDFVCGRNFTYNGKSYKVGEDFPQEDFVGSPEVLVRTRFLIPVVEDRNSKPRHWHREVKVKSEVLDKLGVSYDYDPTEHKVAEVKEYVEAHPEQAAEILEAEEAGKDRSTLVDALEEVADQFNPGEHTVVEVNEYIEDADSDEAARVIDAEKAGKNRKGIVDEWIVN